MHTFKDCQGRTWSLALTLGTVKRIRSMVGIDLLNLEKPDDSGMSAIHRLATDLVLLVDVIWATVQPQALELGVSDEQFGESLGGDALGQASDAFAAELVDFFQKSRLVAQAAAARKMFQARREALEMASSKIDQVDVSAILGEKFSDSPASSESTPTA